MTVEFKNNANLPTIRCGQVVLRPITLEYATESYLEWLNNPTVNQHLETRFRTQTMETLTEYIRAVIAHPDAAQFAIHASNDGCVIGNVKLSGIKKQHFSGVVGYMVGDSRDWGRGFGGAAVGALCAFGFQKVGLKKIRASCYESNSGSVALLKKVGFSQEGVQRYQVETGAGRESLYDFGITDFEFENDRFPAEFV